MKCKNLFSLSDTRHSGKTNLAWSEGSFIIQYVLASSAKSMMSQLGQAVCKSTHRYNLYAVNN